MKEKWSLTDEEWSRLARLSNVPDEDEDEMTEAKLQGIIAASYCHTPGMDDYS